MWQVGECRSLIFGVSLTDYDFTRPEGTQNGEPPIIVDKCIAAVEERGGCKFAWKGNRLMC